MQGKVLTQDNLCKRGFAILNRCVLCEANSENAYIILLDCEYSYPLWIKFLSLWDIGWDFLDSLAKFFDK